MVCMVCVYGSSQTARNCMADSNVSKPVLCRWVIAVWLAMCWPSTNCTRAMKPQIKVGCVCGWVLRVACCASMCAISFLVLILRIFLMDIHTIALYHHYPRQLPPNPNTQKIRTMVLRHTNRVSRTAFWDRDACAHHAGGARKGADIFRFHRRCWCQILWCLRGPSRLE